MEYLGVKDKIKISTLALALIALLILSQQISVLYINAESFLKDSGYITGSLIFALVMVIAILITPLPISPFAFVGGIVFGSILGFITTLISATLGACLAFLIGRYFLTHYFEKKFKKHKIYRKMLEEEHHNLLKFIFFSRLFPRAPFELVSYMAGTTTMPIWKFALSTMLGMVPVIFLLSFFGNIIENYRLNALFIFSIVLIGYWIYKIIIKKRYYVKGY